MKYHTACPACTSEISLWEVIAAPTPFHLSCLTCNVKVGVKLQNLGVKAFLSLVAGTGLMLTSGLILGLFSRNMILKGLVSTAILTMALELIFALLVVNQGEGFVRERKLQAGDADWDVWLY